MFFVGDNIDVDPYVAASNDTHRYPEIHGRPAEPVIRGAYAEWMTNGER